MRGDPMRAPDSSTAASTRGAWERSVVETDLPAACVGLDGRLLQVNDGLCRLVGRSAHELVGTHLNSFAAYPTDARRGRRALASAAAGTPCGGFAQHWTVGNRQSGRVRLLWAVKPRAPRGPTPLHLFFPHEARPPARGRGLGAPLTPPPATPRAA